MRNTAGAARLPDDSDPTVGHVESQLRLGLDTASVRDVPSPGPTNARAHRRDPALRVVVPHRPGATDLYDRLAARRHRAQIAARHALGE
jgi:hypothetical protein